MSDESVADQIARQAREKDQAQRDAADKLASFLELNIARITPQIDSIMRAGLMKIFDTVGPNELQRGTQRGQRVMEIRAHSKSGIHATITARIAGRGPIVENPNDINYVVQYEGYVSTPNNRQDSFKISPEPTIIDEPAALSQFIASTFANRIRQIYEG
jgi:hypothetical protein